MKTSPARNMTHRPIGNPRSLQWRSVVMTLVIAVGMAGSTATSLADPCLDLPPGLEPPPVIEVDCDLLLAMTIIGDSCGDFGSPESTSSSCPSGGFTPPADPNVLTNSSYPGFATCPDPNMIYSGTLTTEFPVYLRDGHKVESVTDLRVKLPGTDYTIVRQYSSDTDWAPTRGQVGNGWSHSNMSYVRFRNDHQIYFYHGGNSRMRLDRDSTDEVVWNGPPNLTITGRQDGGDELGSPEGDLWIIEPGQWGMSFASPYDDFYPEGFLERQVDQWGNVASFQYINSGSTYRINLVKLMSYAPNHVDASQDGYVDSALLKYTWTEDIGSAGKVRSIEAFRYEGTDLHWIQTVRFTYERDVANAHLDLGDQSDLLVQVEYLEATDELSDIVLDLTVGDDEKDVVYPHSPDEELLDVISETIDPDDGTVRQRFRQYRYHPTSRLLTHTFEPEQLEHYMWKKWDGTKTTNELMDELMTKANDALVLDEDASITDKIFEDVYVEDLASKIVTYKTSSEVVDTERIQTNCGCGGSSQGKEIKFTYVDSLSSSVAPPGDPPDHEDNEIDRRVIVEENLYNESTDAYDIPYRKVIHDMASISTGYTTYSQTAESEPETFVRYKATMELDSQGDPVRTWVEAFDYYETDKISENATNFAEGTGYQSQLRKKYFPSAIKSYDANDDDEYPEVEFETTAGVGLVKIFTYWTTESTPATPRRRRTVSVADAAKAGLPGSDPTDLGSIVTRYEYLEIAKNDPGHGREDLVTRIDRFRVDTYRELDDADTASDDDIETTEIAYGGYGVWSYPEDFDWYWARIWTTKVEEEHVGENGPSTPGNDDTYNTVTRRTYFGEIESLERPDGTITKFEYDLYHGQVTKRIESHQVYEDSTNGLKPLTTTMNYDRLGRLISMEEPDKRLTNIRRELRNHETDDDFGGTNFERFVELHFPSPTGADAMQGGHEGADFSGPIEFVFLDAGDNEIGVEQYALSTLDHDGIDVDTFGIGGDIGRNYLLRDIAGNVELERRYHDVDTSGAYYDTEYGFDELGRVSTIKNDVESITRYSYDIFDRVIKEEVAVGSDPSAASYETVGEYFYDSGSGTTQGVGDGNLTVEVRYVDDDAMTDDDRKTVHEFDFRNRRIRTVNPEAPHSLVAYDNLDRVTRRALVDSDSVSPSTLDGADATNRGFLEEYNYSQRGLLYRRARAIDAGADPDTGTFVEWHTWYDSVVRPIKEWAPNQPATKTSYDALGRPEIVSTTDFGGDALPGAAGNHGDADDVTGDEVLEQIKYEYVDPLTAGVAERGAGRVKLVTHYVRSHEASFTGNLHNAGTGDDDHVIASFTALYYDDSGRQIYQLDYGTESTNDIFESGGTAPGVDQDSYPTVDDELWSQTIYGLRGLIEQEVSPDGDHVKYFYDDLDRQVGVIEAFDHDATTLAVVERDATPDYGWKLTDADAGSGNQDVDQTTIFGFDGVDNVTHRVAAFWDGSAIDYQVTEYLYGVSTSDGSPSAGSSASTIDSNDLLREVIYPDEAGAGTPKSVLYWYNLQGEMVAMEDQNGTVHDYTRDDLGRVTFDSIPSGGFGTGIDDWVDEIAITYDDMARRATVKSKDGVTVKNAVEFSYTDLWQVDSVKQNPDGDLNGTNEAIVDYMYDDEDVATGNYSRLETLKYPFVPSGTRTELDVTYGTADELNDVISRFEELTWDGYPTDQTATYEYLGLSMLARKTYDMVGDYGIRLDRHRSRSNDTVDSNETLAGVYEGYDQFGRIRTQLWYDVNSGGTWNDRAIPAIVELAYEYEKDSNVTRRDDIRGNRSVSPDQVRDELYDYDNLDRLTDADRGKHDPGGSPEWAAYKLSQEWSLDALGNWLVFETDNSGDGDFDDPGDISISRDYNLANEYDDPDFAYDDAGNMTRRTIGTTDRLYTYDAWNRLVKVVYDPSGASADDRALFEYNGLHQRTTREADETGEDGNFDIRTLFYYDASWRICEERIDDSYDGSTFTLEKAVQRIWCPLYIDAMIAMMVDIDDDARVGVGGDPDGDFTDPDAEVLYAVSDRKHDVIALINDGGALLERVRYTAYGVAQQSPGGDTNGDGYVDGVDTANLVNAYGTMNGAGNYELTSDFDRSGVVDGADLATVSATWTGSTTAIPIGQISDFGNTIGYSGYVYDRAVDLSLARFRWSAADLGRWMNRDLIEYFDGANLYQYVASFPLVLTDPFGLSPAIPLSIAEAIALGWNARMISQVFMISVVAAQAAINAQALQDRADTIIRNIRRNPKGKSKCQIARNFVKSAENSLKKIRDNIVRHKRNIRDPHGAGGVPCDIDPRAIPGIIRHWEIEIVNFEKEIEATELALESLRKAARKACRSIIKPWTWF